MSKTHTGIFSEDAKEIIIQACIGSSQIPKSGFSVDEYNEVVYDNPIVSTTTEFIKALVRRMKWCRKSTFDYMNAEYATPKRKELYAEELKKMDCIIDLLEKKKPMEEMQNKYGDLYTKFGPCSKTDPIIAEALIVLNERRDKVVKDANDAFTAFVDKLYQDRDIELSKIDDEINAIKKRITA